MLKVFHYKLIAVLLAGCLAAIPPVYPQTSRSVSDTAGQPKDAGMAMNPAKSSVDPGQIVVRPDLNPYNISIPAEFGSVEEIYQGNASSPLVIYIQDVHANYEAQINIRKILAHLVSQYQFSLIQLEGAFSKLNPEILQPSYLKEANLKMLEFLLSEGRVSGADVFAVETDKVIELFGIEDKDLYLENLRVFRSVLAREEEVKAYFAKTSRLVELISQKLLDFKLLDFSRKTKEFSQNKIDLLDFLLYLNQVSEANGLVSLKNLAEIKNYPNLVRIMRVYELEKALDPSKLQTESVELKTSIGEKLPDTAGSEDVLNRIGKTETGTPPRQYFANLTKLADQADVSFLGYPQIRILTEFLVYQDEIDHRGVFPELQKFQAAIKDKIFTAADQNLLLRASDCANLLEQFFALNMNREQLAIYLKNKNEMRPSAIALLLKTLAEKLSMNAPDFGDLAGLDQAMDELEYYYRLVLTRDQVFFTKITNNMKNTGEERSIVVTGGFHKDGLAEKLRKGKISYVVINPKVGVDQGSENYLKVMLEGESAITGVFAGTFALSSPEIIAPIRSGVQNWILVNDAIVTAMIAKSTEGAAVSDQQFTKELRGRINTYVDSVLLKSVGINIDETTGTQYVRAKGTAGLYVGEFGKERYAELEFEALYYADKGTFEVRWKEKKSSKMKKDVVPPSETVGTFSQNEAVSLNETEVPQLPPTTATTNLTPDVFSSSVLLLSPDLRDIPEVLPFQNNVGALTQIRGSLNQGKPVAAAIAMVQATTATSGNTGIKLTNEQIEQSVTVNDNFKPLLKFILNGPAAFQGKSAPRLLAVVSDALKAEGNQRAQLIKSELGFLAETLLANPGAVAIYYAPDITSEDIRANFHGMNPEQMDKIFGRIILKSVKDISAASEKIKKDFMGAIFNDYAMRVPAELKQAVPSLRKMGIVRVLAPQGFQIPLIDGKLPPGIESAISQVSGQAEDVVKATGWLQTRLLPFLPSTQEEQAEFDATLKQIGEPQIIISTGAFQFRVNINVLSQILSIRQAAAKLLESAA